MRDLDKLKETLGLRPHPEGGWFAETWRDPGQEGRRGHGTAIYYLLAAGERSHWHRVDAAEIWHFYAGDPLSLQLWDGQGPVQTLVLGADLAAGERPQLIVPPGHWQAAEPLGGWTLCGCTVAPAFSFDGFEMAPVGWVPAGPTPPPPALRSGAVAIATDMALTAPLSRHLSGSDVQVAWRWEAAARTMCGALHVGAGSEGLPGFVHGGLLAAVCDEAMGWASWMSGHIAPGARVSAEFLHPLRVGQDATVTARLVRQDGRRLHLVAEIVAESTRCVTAKGLYMSIKPRDLSPFLGWPGVERFAAG